MASLQPKQGCLGLAPEDFKAQLRDDAPAQERAITASGARIE